MTTTSINPTIQFLEQGRAKRAFEMAEAVANGNDKATARSYKSYVRKIPALIKTHGIGATFAFVKSKNSNNAYQLIYQDATNWLFEQMPEIFVDHKGTSISRERAEIAKLFTHKTSGEYRRITVELLAFFNWLRRFAEGLIEGDAEE